MDGWILLMREREGARVNEKGTEGDSEPAVYSPEMVGVAMNGRGTLRVGYRNPIPLVYSFRLRYARYVGTVRYLYLVAICFTAHNGSGSDGNGKTRTRICRN